MSKFRSVLVNRTYLYSPAKTGKEDGGVRSILDKWI